jgi:hypothetical protein
MTNRVRLKYLLKKEVHRILSEGLLIENYSEGTITDLLKKWDIPLGGNEEKAARASIESFANKKDSLKNKLDIIVLPDGLKANNRYLDILNYSFEDMENLLRSIPENPEKIKKAAIEKFNKKDGIDKSTAQSYVARFMGNLDKLRLGAKEGITDENGNELISAQEIKDLIPSNLLDKERFLDPRKWSWQSFEQMMDAIFPSQKQVGEEDLNTATVEGDKLYDSEGIEIWKGDDVHKCVSYNPINPETKKKKYGWCVTQIGNTNYDYYRFGNKVPTFYFVFNRNKTAAPLHSPFKDPKHAIVIQITADEKTYIVTDANNLGDRSTDNTQAKGWEGVKELVDAETWEAIKNLKDYFKPIKLSATERARKMASGKNLSLDEFKELNTNDKILYVQGKAQKGELTPDILSILPKIKLPYQGRTTTLANIAIDSGQKFSYQSLKDYPALAARYAVFRFRHTNYGNDPIPLPFIQYLDDKAKETYIEKFKDKLNATVVEKYFGEQYAKEYVQNQLQKLEYIEPKMQKFIANPKLKQLYDIYSKVYEPWEFESILENPEESNYDSTFSATDQAATPVPLSINQWNKLSNQEKNIIIDLVLKNDTNEKYEFFLAAVPYIIKDKDKIYVLLLKNEDTSQGYNWVLADASSGAIVKDDISQIGMIGTNYLYNAYPTNFQRIYNLEDLKIK